MSAAEKAVYTLTSSSAHIYSFPIHLFREFCGDMELDNPGGTRMVIDRFMRANAERWRSDAVRKSKLSTLRHYIAQEKGRAFATAVFDEFSVQRYTTGPKIEQPYKFLKEDEDDRIYTMPLEDFYDHRDFALMDLILNTALRPREIVHLNTRDFDLLNKKLCVRYEVKRQGTIEQMVREIYLSEPYVDAVQDYLHHMFDYAHTQNLGLETGGFPYIVDGSDQDKLPRLRNADRSSYLVRRRLAKLRMPQLSAKDLRDDCIAALVEEGYTKADLKRFQGVIGLFKRGNRPLWKPEHESAKLTILSWGR